MWHAEPPAPDVGLRATGAADHAAEPVLLVVVEVPDVEVDGPAQHAERVEPLLRVKNRYCCGATPSVGTAM